MEDMVMEPRKYKEGRWSQLPQDLVFRKNNGTLVVEFLAFHGYCSANTIHESIAKVLVSLRPQSDSDNNTNDDEIVVIVMYFGSV
ncbi:hypothetical protein LguiB_006497 [Lonicera macranthoides]